MGCCVEKEEPTAKREPTIELTATAERLTSMPSTTPEEDRAIHEAEESLLFHKHKAAHICQLLDSHAEQGKLSPQKFYALTTELELNTKDIDEEGSAMKNFYRKFKEGTRFDVGKLKVLTVLLGQGSVQDKAGLYFDLAAKGREAIDLESIQSLLEVVFAVSVDFLPLLAVRQGGISQKEYIEYTFYLGSQKEQIRDRMSNVILEIHKEVTRKQFVKRFDEDETLKRLCVPGRTRKLLEAEASSIAAPQLPG